MTELISLPEAQRESMNELVSLPTKLKTFHFKNFPLYVQFPQNFSKFSNFVKPANHALTSLIEFCLYTTTSAHPFSEVVDIFSTPYLKFCPYHRYPDARISTSPTNTLQCFIPMKNNNNPFD